MKLVIQTQFRENYGSEDQPYWKFKGGDVYVVENLTPAQAERVVKDGIPTLTALIEYANPMSEEYILSHSVVGDDESVCEEWETPYQLAWVGNRWTARRVIENGEYGWMRKEIVRKTESWDMLMGSERENYRFSYTLSNGNVVDTDEELSRALEGTL